MTPATGIAASAPSIPASSAPIRTEMRTTSGESRTVRPLGAELSAMITFTVFVLSGDGNVVDTLGPFEVVYGREPRFERCV